MGTMIMKCTAILALVIAPAVRSSTNFQVVIGFAICASGVAVTLQAVRSKKYFWAAVFFAIAVLFNPVFTIQRIYAGHVILTAACLLAFVMSLFLLRNLPKQTIASITAQNPGSDSL